MDFILYDGKRIDFEVRRGKRRRTVAIQVGATASVTVFVPPFLGEEKVRWIVRKKAAWILRKQDLMRKNQHLCPPKEFVSGESFPYLGRLYRLKVAGCEAGNGRGCGLTRGRLLVGIDPGLEGEERKRAVREALMGWYRVRAEDKIRERAMRFSEQIGERPRSIKIKEQKRRWGSCSRTGVLRFNWKIIMAPLPVFDYVIVHELCHLKHPHHSGAFWRAVQAILPNCLERRNCLRGLALIADSMA